MLAHFGEHAERAPQHLARARRIGNRHDLVAAEHQSALPVALIINQPGLGRLLAQLELAARDDKERIALDEARSRRVAEPERSRARSVKIAKAEFGLQVAHRVLSRLMNSRLWNNIRRIGRCPVQERMRWPTKPLASGPTAISRESCAR